MVFKTRTTIIQTISGTADTGAGPAILSADSRLVLSAPGKISKIQLPNYIKSEEMQRGALLRKKLASMECEYTFKLNRNI